MKRRLADAVTKSTEKTPAAKVRRRTSKELQRANAADVCRVNRDKQAMKQATVLLIERNKALLRNDPNKMSIDAIVDLTNERLKSNINAKTAARYVREGFDWCVSDEERSYR